jgi:molybdate transport system substrate-binding protein
VLGLARDGLTRGTGALYAVGQIVIFVPEGSPLQPDGSLNDLRHALEGGRLRKFAIANPEHAPYGKRAEEALRHEGLWAAIQSRLVLGENVSQAAQFAVSGSTDGGIIAYSLVLSPRMARRGRYALIPEALHSPLRQRVVLLKNAGLAAERLYDFLRTVPAKSILERYGFVLPDSGG